MNIRACAENLLTYFSPEERSIPDNTTYPGRNATVMKALNGALQELYGKAGAWVRNDERGAVIFAPTTVTITVTTGSTAATILDAHWKSWMGGCALVIVGSAVDNQITNASHVVELKFPHDGTSGTTTATVYCDSITVGADVMEVIEPVRLDRRQLSPMVSPYAFARGRAQADFGFDRRTVTPPLEVLRISGSAGLPIGFFVDTWTADEVTQPVIRMRLYPAPAQAGFLDFTAMLKPPRITSIESTNKLPIPFDAIESIFLPLAIKKLATCPFWRGIVGEQAVNDDFTTANKQLAGSNPAPRSGIRLIPKF